MSISDSNDITVNRSVSDYNDTCITVNTSHTSDITINRSVNDSNNNCINLLSLNCCGIKSRLQYPEFQNMIRNHDILCFVETKTDDLDVINFPGFKFIMKNRKNIAYRRSGGIMVGYRDTLVNMIEIKETSCKYVLWFKCKGGLFKLDQPVIFGVVYIPPEYTKYSSDEAFNEIQQEYLSLLNISKYICLVGDFNARTSNCDDFIILDDNNHNNNNISDYVDNYTEVLESLSLPVERSSMDMIRNRYGNMLLEFCKGNSLFIVNGE